jgi:hypothetical protein
MAVMVPRKISVRVRSAVLPVSVVPAGTGWTNALVTKLFCDGEIMAGDSARPVASCFGGENPKGVLIRLPNGGYPMLLATLSGGHYDPYQLTGVVVFSSKKLGTVFQVR